MMLKKRRVLAEIIILAFMVSTAYGMGSVDYNPNHVVLNTATVNGYRNFEVNVSSKLADITHIYAIITWDGTNYYFYPGGIRYENSQTARNVINTAKGSPQQDQPEWTGNINYRGDYYQGILSGVTFPGYTETETTRKRLLVENIRYGDQAVTLLLLFKRKNVDYFFECISGNVFVEFFQGEYALCGNKNQNYEVLCYSLLHSMFDKDQETLAAFHLHGLEYG